MDYKLWIDGRWTDSSDGRMISDDSAVTAPNTRRMAFRRVFNASRPL